MLVKQSTYHVHCKSLIVLFQNIFQSSHMYIHEKAGFRIFVYIRINKWVNHQPEYWNVSVLYISIHLSRWWWKSIGIIRGWSSDSIHVCKCQLEHAKIIWWDLGSKLVKIVHFDPKPNTNDVDSRPDTNLKCSWRFPQAYQRPSWSWSYGSLIYNYLCNQCLSPLTLWVRIPLMVRCTPYNIMWYSLSVTWGPGCLNELGSWIT
jgi:hypothetical protein